MSDPDLNSIDETQEELETSLKSLGPMIIGNRMAQDQLLQESMVSGGPTSVAEAVCILLDRAGIGVRSLARDINEKRKPLQQMLRGERDISPEVMTKIYDQIEKVKPGMIDRLSKMEV